MAEVSSGELRAQVVAEARRWIGTPYCHQQSAIGAGCDCLGLVRGVWRSVIGPEPAVAPAYSRDWAEAAGRETLLEACGAHLSPVSIDDPTTGDIVVFRMLSRALAKHVAIVSEPGRIIHAFENVGVIEQSLASFLAPRRATRVVAAFSFPGA